MQYGIYNAQTDSSQAYSVFQAKKIQKNALCPLHNIEILLSRIQMGDTVWCASVKSFGSVRMYVRVAMELFHRGVALRSVQEPYLDVGKGRCWKPQTEQLLKTLLQLEMVTVHKLTSRGANNAEQRFIISAMEYHNILALSYIFSGEGILHR